MECDVLLTHEQVGEEAPATSSTDDFFLAQRTSVPIGFVISVSPPVRPYKIWYKHGQQWEKASREVRCKFMESFYTVHASCNVIYYYMNDYIVVSECYLHFTSQCSNFIAPFRKF